MHAGKRQNGQAQRKPISEPDRIDFASFPSSPPQSAMSFVMLNLITLFFTPI
jgi:hypothetical protein